MNNEQRAMVRQIQILARDARRDLSQNAANGTKARPTVAQLNRTLERLAAIELETAHLFATLLPTVMK